MQTRPFRGRLAPALPSLALGLALASIYGPGIEGQESVRQVRIRTESQYVTSGAWSPSGLLLLNLTENRLERMQASGELMSLRPFEALAGWVRPLNESGDLMVQMRNPDEWWAIRVGASSEWALKARWSCERCSIAHWAPLGAERILGAGEVRDEEREEEWKQGIFWVTPDGPEMAYSLEEDQLAMYLLGLQWVTVANGDGYAIVPEPEVDPATRHRFLQIVELPAYNRSERVVTRLPIPVPEITAFQSASHLPETMASLSRQRVPMALVGWRGGLYLVEKTGETFYLWRVDTLTGGLHFLDTIPASDFVTVIPGRDWALLRKGPMVGFGDQRIQSVVLFPGSRLEP